MSKMKLSRNEKELVKRFRKGMAKLGYDESKDYGGWTLVLAVTKLHHENGDTAIIAKGGTAQGIEEGTPPVVAETVRCLGAGMASLAPQYEDAGNAIFDPNEYEGCRRVSGTPEQLDAERERFLSGETTH